MVFDGSTQFYHHYSSSFGWFSYVLWGNNLVFVGGRRGRVTNEKGQWLRSQRPCATAPEWDQLVRTPHK